MSERTPERDGDPDGRALDSVRLRLERLEMSETYQKAQVGRLEDQMQAFADTLRDLQQDSTRICEWARVKENMIQLEEQQRRQASEGFVGRLQSIEAKVGGLLRDKERVVTWSAGAFAGYVAWRGTAVKDLLQKLLGLLQ